MDCSGPQAKPEGEIPPWRQELSRRLHDIRRRRGLDPAVSPSLPFEGESGAPAQEISNPMEPAAPRAAVQRPRIVHERPAPRPVRAVKKVDEPLPLFERPVQKPTAVKKPAVPCAAKAIPSVSEPDPKQVQGLIDTIIARQSPNGHNPAEQREIAKRGVHADGKLILLSRTLAGLIDLLIVGLITGSFVMAADIFSGIDVFDTWSRINCVVLLLAVYFLYSVFFLGTANQTVGMMIKDLRLVTDSGGRPGVPQILGRSAGFLFSLGAGGIGLLWGCLSPDSLCLHDRFSRTQVTRL